MACNKQVSCSTFGSLNRAGLKKQDGSNRIITAGLSASDWYKIDVIIEMYCAVTSNRHDRAQVLRYLN
jgi:hypothetical protein